MSESTAKVRTLPVIASLVGGGVQSAGTAREPTVVRVAGPAFASVQALLNSGAIVDAVVLYPVDAVQALEWASALRREPRLALVPIFTTSAWNDSVAALTDGVIANPAHVFERIDAIRKRLTMLPNRGELDPEERLLAFLYTRPDSVIRPLCDWRTEHLYVYPLLDAFAAPHTGGLEWSAALRRRSLLEPVELIDRVRNCPACSGAHLNFVDVCPQCSAIDIAETIFLHCHTCGHVATQEEFVAHDTLSCPKCTANLRHIGVDYDRALEAFSCMSCSGRFTEPEVKARCLHCREIHKTEELQERRIDSFRLSEAGRLAARTGQVGELFALFDELQCAHPAYFEQTLDFMLKLGRRHGEIEFGLACLKFTNVRELLVRLPRVQVSQMIDGFAMRLRELVRTTDLVLRSDDRHCWLLLPQTPPEGLEVLLSRVRALPPAVASSSDVRLGLNIASVASRTLGNVNRDARLLMAELKAQVQ